MLIGKRMYLKVLEKKDLEGNWYRWLNDQDSTKFTGHGIFPNTYEKQVSYFESINKGTNEITLGMADPRPRLGKSYLAISRSLDSKSLKVQLAKYYLY